MIELRSLLIGLTVAAGTAACDRPNGAAAEKAAAPAILVYDDVRSDLADMFDLRSGRYAQIPDEDIPDPTRSRSDIGGAIDLCSNAEFHCRDDGLYLAIPKGRLTDSWTFLGIACRSRPVNGARSYRIVCRAGSRPVETEFIYSRPQGILSYTHRCAECRPQNYVLVGEVGLFAQP
ncbi:MAG TPA: hypothetical protein VD887_10890 [Allosphingosinicella sp.]|nr:hypothetical protein [Allosphingosinicella sp.]